MANRRGAGASGSAIRSRFRIFEGRVYLNSCAQGALSRRVEAAFGEYLESWHHQGSPWGLWVEKYEEARRLLASFLGAGTDEVALVASAPAGVNSVARLCRLYSQAVPGHGSAACSSAFSRTNNKLTTTARTLPTSTTSLTQSGFISSPGRMWRSRRIFVPPN